MMVTVWTLPVTVIREVIGVADQEEVGAALEVVEASLVVEVSNVVD